MSHSMSQHHSTPFSESRNHMNVLLTLTFRLRWNSTDKLPHKYTSSYQLTPLRSHFDSLLASIGPISITSFDALKGLRGFGGAGIGRPSERHCSCIKAFSRWPRGPVFSQLTTKMEIECGKTFQLFPLYSHSMSFNNVSLLFLSGITDLFLGKMQNYRVKGRMNAQTWSNLRI